MVMFDQHWHVFAGSLRSRDDDPRDMNRATLGQSVSRDILIPSVAFRV